jgi:hypothetical protein
MHDEFLLGKPPIPRVSPVETNPELPFPRTPIVVEAFRAADVAEDEGVSGDLTPDNKGDIPAGYIPLQSGNNSNYALLRSILKSDSPRQSSWLEQCFPSRSVELPEAVGGLRDKPAFEELDTYHFRKRRYREAGSVT